MRHFATAAFFLALFAFAPSAKASNRQVDDILAQAIPEGADHMNVGLSSSASISVSPSTTSFSTPLVSTGSVTSSTAKVALPASATRAASLITNECSSPVRIGGVSVSSTTGQFVPAGGSISLDAFQGPFRGVLYIISTTGTCAWSASEVLP